MAGNVQPIRPAQYRHRPFTSKPSRTRTCASQRPKQSLFACDRTEQLTGSSSGLDASVSSSGASDDGILFSSMSSASARAMELQLPLFFLCTLPALAAEPGDFSQGSASSGSYYATLFLFIATLPGLWSLVKRAPKASIKKKVFEVPGPKADADVVPLDVRARQVFDYFSKYNYEVRERGEVITFVGNYKASKGQAAALVFYVFFGLASAALVLSIAAPFGGNWWYGITLISPAAGAYYLRKGDREEEFKVKMVTADDELTTDIITAGDVEETTRFCAELGLREKGKVYVKGILEQ
eukprot:CAMPEP_0206135262 /NCGR_PEP_ID=MMETSP1473-20131121/592_1 /ASSEMBLY_ACC=CAM_ASM_001109 /TAXON_ID=1461547 /ORGANISM="Stichococcus sp, Strain RCC1054" /LENGTH=295 /DNA_ID=CAMNT_0053527063 /DNA_START=289 /DNA_END=1176 /DNA_ORIENTATION=+